MSILHNINNALDDIKGIHDNSIYLKEKINNEIKNKSNKKKIEISINASNENPELKEPVQFDGTGNGIVKIYSNNEYIIEAPAIENKWYVTLSFSESGIYIIRASDAYGSATVKIEVKN